MAHYKLVKDEISKQESFDIKNFKKILCIYTIIFVILCVLVPCNTYFDGKLGPDYSTKDKEGITNYGLRYTLIWQVGYQDYNNDRINIEGYYKFGKGVMITKLNIPILFIELLVLTLIFSVTSFILCKRKN
ncbi:MAG: hypothetical protein AB9836_03045 [Aminipila sp.]